jgi:hypothetical protein
MGYQAALRVWREDAGAGELAGSASRASCELLGS